MDRQRFVPAPEGLEGRALMSTLFGNSNAAGYSNRNAVDVPYTLEQKERRITNLPFYINQLQPGRFLPRATIEDIQNDLQPLVGKLHAIPSRVITNYDHFLRDIFSKETISASDAHGLNRAFGAVLIQAGAPGPVVAKLQASMTDLARVDANSPNSLYLATNDYSLVLQTALAVGHPLKQPGEPMLAVRDGIRKPGGGITNNPQPTLVGTYEAGGVVDPGTQVHIIDSGTGQVLGSTPLQTTGRQPTTGRYAVTFDSPLAVGKHIVRIQTEVDGIVSTPSPAFVLKVTPPAGERLALSSPQGPLGLK